MLGIEKLSKKTLLEITTIAWPLALNAVLMHSVTIIDLLLIAPLGEVSVAAYGIGFAIVTYVLGVQMSTANGTQFVLSRAIGAGDSHKIGMEMMAGLIVNMSFTLVLLILLFFNVENIVHAIIEDNSVALQAISYIEVSLYLMVFTSIAHVIVVYFNSAKKTRIPLYGFILEIPINIFFSVVLIHGLWGAPELGLMGAALGSLIAVIFRVIYLVIRFRSEVRKNRVSGFFNITIPDIKKHTSEVLPVLSNFAVLLTGHTTYQILFAQLSVTSYAAITLILPWIKIGSMFANSWARSSTIFVSQYIGKGELKIIPNFVFQSSFVTTSISVFMMLCFFIFSVIVSLIYPDLSTETLSALAIIAPIYIILPLFRTSNMFCGNMMRALGESYIIVRINIIGMWCIALPLCAYLIYIDAPLFYVFGVLLFEEVVKFYKFRKTLQTNLKRCEKGELRISQKA